MSDALFLLLTAACVVMITLIGHRGASKNRVIRRIYRHVDEQLGAKQFENNRRASRRRLLALFSLQLANVIYPVAQYGGVSALPSTRRIRRYVQVEWVKPGPPWPRTWRVWHVHAVDLRWTSEANALGQGFGDLLARKVAQALILDSPSALTQVPAFDQGYFRLARRQPLRPVPTVVPFGEATDE